MSTALKLAVWRGGTWVDCGDPQYCYAVVSDYRHNRESRPVVSGVVHDAAADLALGDRVRVVTPAGRLVMEGCLTRLVRREAAGGRIYEFEATDYVGWYRNAWVWLRYTSPQPLSRLVEDVVAAVNRAAGRTVLVRYPRGFESAVTVEGEYSGGALDLLGEVGRLLDVTYQQAVVGGQLRLVGVKGRGIVLGNVFHPADALAVPFIGHGGVTEYQEGVAGMLARRGQFVSRVGRTLRVKTRVVRTRTAYAEFKPAADAACAGPIQEPCAVFYADYAFDPAGEIEAMVYFKSGDEYVPLATLLKRGEIRDGQVRISDARLDYVVDVDYWRQSGERGLRIYMREPLAGYYEQYVDPETGKTYDVWVPHYLALVVPVYREFVLEVPGSNDVQAVEDYGDPLAFSYVHGSVNVVTGPTGDAFLDGLLFSGEDASEAEAVLIGEAVFEGARLREPGGEVQAAGLLVGLVHEWGGGSLGTVKEYSFGAGGFRVRFAPSSLREIDEEVLRLKREVRGLKVRLGGAP